MQRVTNYIAINWLYVLMPLCRISMKSDCDQESYGFPYFTKSLYLCLWRRRLLTINKINDKVNIRWIEIYLGTWMVMVVIHFAMNCNDCTTMYGGEIYSISKKFGGKLKWYLSMYVIISKIIFCFHH